MGNSPYICAMAPYCNCKALFKATAAVLFLQHSAFTPMRHTFLSRPRAVGRSENSGGKVLFGEHKSAPTVGIGLTNLLKIGVWAFKMGFRMSFHFQNVVLFQKHNCKQNFVNKNLCSHYK